MLTHRLAPWTAVRCSSGKPGLRRHLGAVAARLSLLVLGVRNLMPRPADRWRLLEPTFRPGYSDTPDDFLYPSSRLRRLPTRPSSPNSGSHQRCVIVAALTSAPMIGLRFWPSPIPCQSLGLLIQNGEHLYEDQLGPGTLCCRSTGTIRARSAGKPSCWRRSVRYGYRDEFRNAPPGGAAGPAAAGLCGICMVPHRTPRRREIYTDVIAELRENLAWLPLPAVAA